MLYIYAICKNAEHFADRRMDAVSEADWMAVADAIQTLKRYLELPTSRPDLFEPFLQHAPRSPSHLKTI